jgi:hypothetical protein
MKCWYLLTGVHGVTNQNNIVILTAMRSSNLTYHNNAYICLISPIPTELLTAADWPPLLSNNAGLINTIFLPIP